MAECTAEDASTTKKIHHRHNTCHGHRPALRRARAGVFFLVASLAVSTELGAQDEESTEKLGAVYEVEMLAYSTENKNDEQYPLLLNLHYPSEVDRFHEGQQQDSALPGEYGEYLPLEEKTPEFSEYAKKLAEQPGHSILLHKRWRQLIPEQAQARYLLIEGGAPYGRYHELQGVLLLYAGRYLHSEMELWLSDFSRSGRSSQPLPPLPPRKEEKEEIQLFQTEIGPFRRKARNLIDNLNAQEEDNAVLPVAMRVVRLEENRRMRSRIVHYFDHPLMGVLLRITPVDRAE